MRPVAALLALSCDILSFILLAYIVISWLRLWQRTSRSAPQMRLDNPVVRGIEGISDTVLRPIRRVIHPYQRDMAMDFSPIIVFLLLGLIGSWAARLPF